MRRLLVLSAALAFAACASDPDASGEAEGGAVTPGAALSGEACLHGTWAADAEHTFRPETWERLMPQQEGAPQVRLHETAGRALVTFAPDGAMRQRFEDFRVTFDSEAGGQPMRLTLAMDGSNGARYTLDGDRLTFQPDAGANDIEATMSIEMDGRPVMEPQRMDGAMFEPQEGDAGGTAVTYTCRGDELLLDIAEAEEGGQVFFDDARYTRAD